jgi:gliding motility associated protien GldN
MHFVNSKPVEYTFLRQDDIMWSTRHWERIDMREKINHPLYYPVKPQPDRKSLFDVVRDGILVEGTIREVFRDDKFEIPLTNEEVFAILTRVDTIRDPDDPSIILNIDSIQIKAPNVVAWDLKSDWYFDKQRGEMKSRIIGISPLVKEPGTGEIYNAFWVWFPDARQALATNIAYNPYNNHTRMTFDQIMAMRYFNARITKEDNTYDRSIEEYKKGSPMGQLLESQAIKDKLRSYEHDLWEF